MKPLILSIALLSFSSLPLLASTPREAWEGQLYRQAMNSAQKDPVAAAKWALGLEPDKKKNMALRVVFQQWSGKEPEKAARWGQTIEDDAARHIAVAGAMYGWARAGEVAEKAIAWMDGLDDGEDRANALYHFVLQWSFHEPEKAGALSMKSLQDEKRDAAIRHVASTWLFKTKQDTKPVFAWIATFDDAKLQQSAVDSIVHGMMFHSKADPDKLGKEILLLENEKVKSNMLCGLIKSFASPHAYDGGYVQMPAFRAVTPEKAKEMAKSIPDATLQAEAIGFVEKAAAELKK